MVSMMMWFAPGRGCLQCAGFTEGKKNIINSILTPEDWAMIKWFHHEPDGNWLFTHAGAQLDILPEFNLETAPLDVLKFAVPPRLPRPRLVRRACKR